MSDPAPLADEAAIRRGIDRVNASAAAAAERAADATEKNAAIGRQFAGAIFERRAFRLPDSFRDPASAPSEGDSHGNGGTGH